MWLPVIGWSLLQTRTTLPERALLIQFVTKLDESSTDSERTFVVDALRRRDWATNQIDRPAPVRSANAWRASVPASFPGGLVYLCGTATLRTSDLQPVFEFADGTNLPIQTVLNSFQGLPAVVLPDTGYTNTFYTWRPESLTVIASTGSWASTQQPRAMRLFALNGQPIERMGTFSAALWRALPLATDVRDLAERINHHSGTSSMAAMWSDLYGVQVLGSGLWTLPGRPATPRTASTS